MGLLFTSLALSALCQATPSEAAPIPVLVISGANNHDWRFTTPSLAQILEESGRFDVTITYEPAKDLTSTEALAKYRAFVLDYNGAGWGDVAHAAFLESVRGGTGVVCVHAADNSGRSWPEYERLVGDLWREGTGHGRFHPFDVTMTDRDHPVTRTLPTILMHPDELYHKLVNVHDVERRVLATAFSDPETGGTGENEPMILTRSYGKGRVFHTPLGHVWVNNIGSQASHRDPQFRGLITRGTEWAATGTIRDERIAPKELTSAQKAAGWRSLMDRAQWQSFSGGGVPPGWRFEGDTVMRAASSGDIVTRELFENFELEWQWKTTIASNSGVKYRIPEGADRPIGPEYQMLDAWSDEKRDEHRAGALYDVVDTKEVPALPWGDFHSSRIVARGPVLEHYLDGVLVMRTDTSSPAWTTAVADSKFKAEEGFGAERPGRVLLQDHGDEVWIRSMRIRPLETGDDAPVDDKFMPLFHADGDLSAWSNVGDAQYRVENDMLIGEAGPKRQQSFLVASETLHDFELQIDVKIAVLGNSGIQIRSHLNDKGRFFGYQAEIDPTQRSWSAGIYDEGRRGWLNDLSDNQPAREAFELRGWNAYRILCEGPRIRTWVNGVPAADLLDAADLSGSLGFQVHGGDDDIVIQWRGAKVKRLGKHEWLPAGGDDEGTRAFDGAAGLRALVMGDASTATITFADGTKSKPIVLAATKYWHKGGHNRIAILHDGDHVVLQVGDRTTFEHRGSAPLSVTFENEEQLTEWERCAPWVRSVK